MMGTAGETLLAPEPGALAPSASDAGAPDRSHQRALQFVMRVYEIAEVLRRFESIEATLPQVIAVLARALPLHTVLLLGAFDGGPRAFAWRAKGETHSAYAAAKVHARGAYTYLMGPGAPEAPDLEGRDPEPACVPSVPAVRAGEPTMLVALPLVLARGAVFGVLQIGAGARLDEQDLAFLASVVHQIALALEREARETKGARSRETLAGIIRILSDGIVAFDMSRRIQIFNDAAATIFGVSREEAIGALLSRILEPREESRVLELAGDASRVRERMELGRRGDEGERLLDVTVSKLAIGGEPVIVLIARDITDRRLLELAGMQVPEHVLDRVP